jgi:hypothetical protein
MNNNIVSEWARYWCFRSCELAALSIYNYTYFLVHTATCYAYWLTLAALCGSISVEGSSKTVNQHGFAKWPRRDASLVVQQAGSLVNSLANRKKFYIRL